MAAINPRVDIAFKKIFGIEENKDLLISLINSIVGEKDQVVDVTLLNPYNEKNFKTDKLSILDIKAEGSNGRKFNIEIQITDEADYDKRALYYWAKIYTDQLKQKESYAKLKKVIGIHILNFTSILESKKYHNAFHITEKETGLHCFEELELHTIELKKFVENLGKKFENIGTKIQNALDLWSAFLTKHDLLDKANLSHKLDSIPVKKALEVLKVMNFSAEERETYEDRLSWLRIEASGLKKAEERGAEKGFQRGKEEGEKKEKYKIARSMFSENLPFEQISRLTGLSEKELENLGESK